MHFARCASVCASTKHLVQFAAGIAVAQLGERSLLRDLARRAHETAPRGARQRTADTNAADTEIGGFRHREAGRPDQKIDRLGVHGLYDGRYLLPGLDARRVEAIRA